MSSLPERDMTPVVIVTTPKAGHVNQCIAFCEAAGWPANDIHRLPKSAKLPFGLERFISRRRRAALAQRLAEMHGDAPRLRLVASGTAAEPVVAFLRESLGPRLFAVFIGTPRQGTGVFDAAVSSRHEIAGDVSEVIALAGTTAWIDGTLVRRVARGGAPERRHLTVLIGGVNRTFTLPAGLIATQLESMASQLDIGMAAVTLVVSRRTPPDLAAALRAAFPAARHIAATDRAGFEEAYAAASHLAVTPDSITMVCEACASGKPVGVFALESRNDDSSAARFIHAFRNARHIAWGRLPDAGEALVPWNTGEAVARVMAAYQAWRARQAD
jgi:mitochondrial fission protein ELM1